LAEAEVVDVLAPIGLHPRYHGIHNFDPKIERQKDLDDFRGVPAGYFGESWV
jgi:hypothetical protein